MKLTKQVIRDLIKEELEANLEEQAELPADITRAYKAIFGDSGDDKYIAYVKKKVDGMNPNRKVQAAITVLSMFGLDAEAEKLRTAMGAAKDGAAAAE